MFTTYFVSLVKLCRKVNNKITNATQKMIREFKKIEFAILTVSVLFLKLIN